MGKSTLTDIGKTINMDLEILEENTGLVILASFDIFLFKTIFKNATSIHLIK